MSTESTSSSYSQNLKLFINEFYEKTTKEFGRLENFIITKINDFTPVNPYLQKTINKIKKNKEIIINAICSLGMFYNFDKSPIFFATGLSLGMFTSSSTSLLQSLTWDKLLYKSGPGQSNYFSAKVITVLSALSATSKISAPFSIAGGFILGTWIDKEIQQQRKQNELNRCIDFINNHQGPLNVGDIVEF